MKLVCCVCGFEISDDGKDDNVISHTYCDIHYFEMIEKIKKMKEKTK